MNSDRRGTFEGKGKVRGDIGGTWGLGLGWRGVDVRMIECDPSINSHVIEL